MVQQHPVLLFDGVCNLCNGWVQLVIRNDPEGRFRFAALQSEKGQELLKQYGLPHEQFTTLVFIENGKVYTRSSAALRIAKQLNGAWPLLYAFSVVPAFLRDGVYNLVAGNRYAWFGKQESCMLPTPELKARFLE